jgi:cellulose synthase/poly-beta-1,6-N-acetylglucosamine synthase-like glycosyltransferase
MIFLQVFFWISIFLVFYTYILFPFILQLMATGKSMEHPEMENGSLPFVSVIVAAFNEEEVIEEKIRSVLDSDFPADRFEILVGSDASTDRTNQILHQLEKDYPVVKISEFNTRTGKPGVVNRLAAESKGEILVITDANVMLGRDTLKQLAGSFTESGIGLVDTCMVNTRLKKDGISHQEKFYISREVRIKYNESVLWGSMMGPFGGCYAVRKRNYRPVPDHFLVDDFYINMSVLQQGFRCISHIDAKVYEDVSNDLKEEYRRKTRISAGNFQNLVKFGSLLFSGRAGVAFCFLSHKVIRWFVPFLVIITLGTSIALGAGHPLYMSFALFQVIFLLVPVIDRFLRLFKIHSIPLRFISHFVIMNLALLAGFIRYIGGIKSNVWQPTRRNQGESE